MYRKQHKKVSAPFSIHSDIYLFKPSSSLAEVVGISCFFFSLSFGCRQYLQDIAAEAVKKRRRTTKKPYSRSIVGATLEVIQKRRSEKPEVRDAAREAALRYV